MKILINDKEYECCLEQLSNKSYYFEALIRSNYKEQTLNEINITLDCDIDCLQKYLQYIKNESELVIVLKEMDIDNLYYMWNIMDFFQDKNLSKFVEIFNSKIREVKHLEEEEMNIFYFFFKKNLFDWKDLFYNGNLLVDNNYIAIKETVLLYCKEDFDSIKLLKYWSQLLRENTNLNSQVLVNYFDFIDYLKYDEPKKYEIYEAKSNFQIDENVYQWKSIEEFKSEFVKLSFGLIQDDFDWSNILIAGGILLYPTETSDIDLWLYDCDEATKIKKIKYVLEYLKSKTKEVVYYSKRNQVVSILITGVPRTLQLITTSYANKFEVIKNFDFDCLNTIYDGNQLLTTYECLKALKYQTIFQIHCVPKRYRPYKFYKKGFSFTKKAIHQVFPEFERGSFEEYLKKLPEIKKINHCLNKSYCPMIQKHQENIEKIKEIFGAQLVTTDLNEILLTIINNDIECRIDDHDIECRIDDHNDDNNKIDPYNTQALDIKYISKIEFVNGRHNNIFFSRPIVIKDQIFDAEFKKYTYGMFEYFILLNLDDQFRLLIYLNELNRKIIDYLKNKPSSSRDRILYYEIYGKMDYHNDDHDDNDEYYKTKNKYKKYMNICYDIKESKSDNLFNDIKDLRMRIKSTSLVVKSYPSNKMVKLNLPCQVKIKADIYFLGIMLHKINRSEIMIYPIKRIKNIIIINEKQIQNLTVGLI